VGWLEVLEKAEGKKKQSTTTHNTPPSKRDVAVNISPKVLGVSTDKTDKTPDELANHAAKQATELGLIAHWSYEFGYVSLHDPTSGEWHDLPTKEAPSWAGWEARRRKQLYKDGNRKAYRLTAREMEEIWKAEHTSDPEGIVEDYPLEEG
jgi:hypothetical protein